MLLLLLSDVTMSISWNTRSYGIGVFEKAVSCLLEKGKSVMGLWELLIEQNENG